MQVINPNTTIPEDHPLLMAGFSIAEISEIEMMYSMAWEKPETREQFYENCIRLKQEAGNKPAKKVFKLGSYRK